MKLWENKSEIDLNPGVGNYPVIIYICTSEPSRLGCVISIQKGVNATSAEKGKVRKRSFPALYIPPPVLQHNYDYSMCTYFSGIYILAELAPFWMC